MIWKTLECVIKALVYNCKHYSKIMQDFLETFLETMGYISVSQPVYRGWFLGVPPNKI